MLSHAELSIHYEYLWSVFLRNSTCVTHNLHESEFLPFTMFVNMKGTASFAIFAKTNNTSSRISFCPSVRIEQICSHWTVFHEIWYLKDSRKSVGKIQVSLNSDGNDGYCTRLYNCYSKGKVTPLQARCGPEVGYRYSSTLPWPQHQKGMSGQQHALAALYSRERPGTHFTGGWAGPRAGLDGGGGISSPPGFDPGPSSP